MATTGRRLECFFHLFVLICGEVDEGGANPVEIRLHRFGQEDRPGVLAHRGVGTFGEQLAVGFGSGSLSMSAVARLRSPHETTSSARASSLVASFPV